MNGDRQSLYGGLTRLSELTGESIARDVSADYVGKFVGRLALHGYLDLSLSNPLHGLSEPKLREGSHRNTKETFAKYLGSSLHIVVDRSLLCSREDKIEELSLRIGDKTMTLPDHLRNLPDGNFPRRSIEWMLQRIAEQYIFDPNEDHWEDGMARNVGLALAREVVRTQPATRLNEFYTFLDVVVDLSHPRH